MGPIHFFEITIEITIEINLHRETFLNISLSPQMQNQINEQASPFFRFLIYEALWQDKNK